MRNCCLVIIQLMHVLLNCALDLNLLDWSSSNLLAVCLGPRLYLWNASNGEIHQLLEMDNETEYVSSVAWLPDASHIAVGTSTMEVQVLQSATLAFCATQSPLCWLAARKLS